MKAAVISVILMLSSSDQGQICVFFLNMSSQNGEFQQKTGEPQHVPLQNFTLINPNMHIGFLFAYFGVDGSFLNLLLAGTCRYK